MGARGREFWTDIWDTIGPEIEQILAGGPSTWHEDQFIPIERNDGLEDVYWTYGYSPAFGDDGTIQGVLVVCQETTSRVLAEAEARQVGERLSTVLESISDAFFTLDAEWRFTFVNSEAERLVERTRAELLGKVVWDVFPEAADSTFHTEYRRAVDEGVTVRFEEYFAPLQRWFAVNAYPSGEGLAVYFQDVTERRQATESLVERDRLLGIAGRAARIGGWMVELESGSVHWSDEVCAIHGMPPGTRLSLEQALAFYPLEWRPVIEEHFGRCVEEGTPFDLVLQILPTDGGPLWVRAIGEALRDPDGAIRRVQGAFQDITDQRTAEEAIVESGRRLRELAEAMPVIVWSADPQGRIDYQSRAMLDFSGRTREALIGEGWMEVVHPEDREATRNAWTESVATGEPYQAEFRIRRHDGAYRWHVSRAVPYRDRAGTILKWYGSSTEVHDQYTARARLREQAELLDRVQDAILVRDLDHRITYWNASARKLYGWSADEVLGRPSHEVLGVDPEVFQQGTARVLEAGYWSGELHHVSKDGFPLVVEARWALVRNEAGDPLHILSVHTDISERKKLLAQFLRAQRMESIGTLAGGIAHDLNNVLAPILMSIGLLRRSLPGEDERAILETIESSARRGADMVKQVLGFARGVDGREVTVELPAIIEEVAAIVRETFPKNILLTVDCEQGVVPLKGDPTQIHQVFMNLLVNARDAMPSGGSIRITAEGVDLDSQYAAMSPEAEPGLYIRVEVEDTGTGMHPEVVAQIFDPFFTTKEVGDGTGLGLSTVAGILRSHGGWVNVYSEPGHGTTFRLYFPVGEPTDAVRSGEDGVEPPRGNGELILVVDDESSILDITRQTLEASGYRVLTASDGAEAVAIYGKSGSRIDLVLTDIMMPVMDGPTTIRVLKHMNPEVRVVASSGMGANGGVARAIAAGVVHFLDKPYNAASLLGVVHRAIHAPAEARD